MLTFDPPAPLLGTLTKWTGRKSCSITQSRKTGSPWQEEVSQRWMENPTTQADTCMSWECSVLPVRSQSYNVSHLITGVEMKWWPVMKHCCRSKLQERMNRQWTLKLEYSCKGSRDSKFLAGMIRITIKCSCLNRKPAWVSSWLQ